MSKFFISLFIGIIAGIIDIFPMLLQKIDKYSCISAFIHWMVLGIIISYINFPIVAWLKGLIIAEISALPIIILLFKKDPNAIIPIILMSAILGILVGISTTKFAN